MELLTLVTFLPLIVVILLILACVAEEAYRWTTILVFLGLVYIGLVVGFGTAWVWAMTNPTLLISYICGYGVAGVLTSFFLWDRFCARKAKVWKEQYNSDPGQKKYWMPVWYNNKAKITANTILWPLALLNWFVGRFIVELLNWLQTLFGNIYKKLSERHFKDAPDPEKPRLF